MPNDPPPLPPLATALPYEPMAARELLWPAMRVGLAVWALATIGRHAIYWTMIAGNVSPQALVALGEAFVLTVVAVVALRNRAATPAVIGLLGGLGIAMLALIVAGLSVEVFTTMGLRSAMSPARFLWMIAGRAGTAAIPVMLVVASRAAPR